MDKLDVKLWSLAAKGQIVPDRSLLKTPEQIAAIRKSADLNTAVLDHVAAHIHAGMSTAEIDKLVYDFTTEHGGVPAPLNYEGFRRVYALLSTMSSAMVSRMKMRFWKKAILSM